MNLQEFRNVIKDKTFHSSDGTYFQFIEDTLKVKNNFSQSVKYEIDRREDGKFVLHHNNLFGTEPILMDIISKDGDKLQLSLSSIPSNKFIGTWKEV